MVGFMAYKGIVARRAAMNGNNSTTRPDKYVRETHDRDTNSTIVKNRTEIFSRVPFKIGTISLLFRFCHVTLD